MRIIVATDGTDCGLGAVKAVGHLKLDRTDEILVITVVDMSPPLGFESGIASATTADIESAFLSHAERAITSARQILSELDGVDSSSVESDILYGSPAKRIVEAAEDWTADLIVIGSHGYSKWQRILLGSVSDSVVHHAHCSVMVVRANECQEGAE